jgi:Membrane bound O-acyl transferase family
MLIHHSKFWHQMFSQPFSSLAHFLVHDILCLTNYRSVARYAKILVTFFVSGLLHMVVDLALGMSFSETGSVRFFCTQALGIALEDGVQTIYRSVRGVRGTKRSAQPGSWAKALGYIWVVAFLSWSTPVWVYPAIRMNQGGAKDRILPFSVTRLFLGRE